MAWPASWSLSLLVALLVLWVPSSSAETVRFEEVQVQMSAESFDALLLNQAVEDVDASDLRAYIDEEYGDADGVVVEEEYEAYRTAEVADFNDRLNSPFAASLFADIKVNTRPVRALQVTDMTLSGNTLGSVDDVSTIRRDLSARLVFTDTTSSRVNVSFEQDFRIPFRIIEMEWGTGKILGAEAWAIDPKTIHPDGKENPYWDGTGFTVPYAESGSFSSKERHLRFDLVDTSVEKLTTKEKKKDSPGPIAAGLVAALALVAFMARRRVA